MEHITYFGVYPDCSIGDAISIACMNFKKFSKLDFKKFHPGGSLSLKLKTVSDLMVTGKKLPIVNESVKMKNALKIIENKKLGVLLVKNKLGNITGIITDGDLKRIAQRFKKFDELIIKKVMKKNPYSVDVDTLMLQLYQ